MRGARARAGIEKVIDSLGLSPKEAAQQKQAWLAIYCYAMSPEIISKYVDDEIFKVLWSCKDKTADTALNTVLSQCFEPEYPCAPQATAFARARDCPAAVPCQPPHSAAQHSTVPRV